MMDLVIEMTPGIISKMRALIEMTAKFIAKRAPLLDKNSNLVT